MEIILNENLWIDRFERIARKNFTESKKQEKVSFIFGNNLKNIDSLSAALLFGWALYLTKFKNINVEFSIKTEQLSNQVSKILFGNKLLNTLKDYGINTPVKYHSITPPNYHINIVTDENHLDIILKDIEKELYYYPQAVNAVKDISNIIIRELILNSLIHPKKNAYPFIYITNKILEQSKGFIHLLSNFEKGQEILEICIDRKSTRLNSSHIPLSRMPSSA